MAHKGKAYPRAEMRDYSLSPAPYCYLPRAWRWSGMVATGAQAPLVNGKILTLEQIPAPGARTNPLVWEYAVLADPFHLFYFRMYYTLLRTPLLAQLRFEMITGFLPYLSHPPCYVAASFPYNNLPSTWTNLVPAGLKLTSLGTFEPEPWPT